MLTERDEEVLRFLLRTQLASTRLVQLGFFPSQRRAQQRLQYLRAGGWVLPHRKGLPEAVAGASTYWRLTSRGVEVVAARFPEEPIPANAVHRAMQASLRYHEHRDALTEVYLGLVQDGEADVGVLRARSSAFIWRREHEVVLEAPELGRVHQVVPDATVETSVRRYFLELDRSTESHARCARQVKRYAASVRSGRYAATFGDQAAPVVVYVTKSATRAENLRASLQAVGSAAVKVAVYEERDAVRWLRRELFGAEDAVAPGQAREGAAAAAAAPSRDEHKQTLKLLRLVYGAWRDEIQRRLDDGDQIDKYPPWVDSVVSCLNNQ